MSQHLHACSSTASASITLRLTKLCLRVRRAEAGMRERCRCAGRSSGALPATRAGTTRARPAKVGACACTNTWTREAYNVGAQGVVINMKTASTLTPGVVSPARTHARLAAHPAPYRQTARGNEASSTCRVIACVLSMRRSMSILWVPSTLFLTSISRLVAWRQHRDNRVVVNNLTPMLLPLCIDLCNARATFGSLLADFLAAAMRVPPEK